MIIMVLEKCMQIKNNLTYLLEWIFKCYTWQVNISCDETWNLQRNKKKEYLSVYSVFFVSNGLKSFYCRVNN